MEAYHAIPPFPAYRNLFSLLFPPISCDMALCLANLLATRVTLEQAMSSRLVQRWSTSASLDRKELDLLWGGSDLAGSMKRADKFKV